MTDYAKHCRKEISSTCQGQGAQGGKIGLNALVLLGLVLGLAIYLAQTNSLISIGFEMRDHQKEKANKQQAIEELQAQAAQLQSLPALENSIQGRQMVPSSNVSFLPAVNNAVALRR